MSNPSLKTEQNGRTRADECVPGCALIYQKLLPFYTVKRGIFGQLFRFPFKLLNPACVPPLMLINTCSVVYACVPCRHEIEV